MLGGRPRAAGLQGGGSVGVFAGLGEGRGLSGSESLRRGSEVRRRNLVGVLGAGPRLAVMAFHFVRRGWSRSYSGAARWAAICC